MVKSEVWQTDPGQTQVWPGYDLDQIQPMNEDLPSYWLLWETPLLIDRLGLMFKKIPQTAVARHGRVSQRGRRRHQELSCHTGRCMSVHYSDPLHTKGIWDMLQEKQAHTGPDSAVKYSYPKGISNVFSFNKKGWLKILNMQWQNGLKTRNV